MAVETFGPSAVALGGLPEVLRMRSERRPDDTAYVFLRNGETPEDTLTL